MWLHVSQRPLTDKLKSMAASEMFSEVSNILPDDLGTRRQHMPFIFAVFSDLTTSADLTLLWLWFGWVSAQKRLGQEINDGLSLRGVDPSIHPTSSLCGL